MAQTGRLHQALYSATGGDEYWHYTDPTAGHSFEAGGSYDFDENIGTITNYWNKAKTEEVTGCKFSYLDDCVFKTDIRVSSSRMVSQGGLVVDSNGLPVGGKVKLSFTKKGEVWMHIGDSKRTRIHVDGTVETALKAAASKGVWPLSRRLIVGTLLAKSVIKVLCTGTKGAVDLEVIAGIAGAKAQASLSTEFSSSNASVLTRNLDDYAWTGLFAADTFQRSTWFKKSSQFNFKETASQKQQDEMTLAPILTPANIEP